jgi:beta-lactam-binding protein with PASTA domain
MSIHRTLASALILILATLVQPAFGQTAAPTPGTNLSVTPDSESKKIKVPRVVDLTEAQAKRAIIDADLKVGAIENKSSDTIADDHVISENPVAGTFVSRDSKVNLVISEGKKVTVPELVGLNLGKAKTKIVEADLNVGAISEQFSTTVAADHVIGQDPEAGKREKRHTRVDLVVSKGPPKTGVTVPNVVGLTQTAASTAITGAGLTVGTVTTQSSATVAAGLVISESPVSGTSVASGSAVNFVVSSGTVTTGELITEHALAQTGLAIGLASTVLQTQLEILGGVDGGIPTCQALTGGGSALSGPPATTVTIFYDGACTNPYLVADANETITTEPSGAQKYTIGETATYDGLGGSEIGTLTLNETALQILDSGGTVTSVEVNGLGIFTPSVGVKTPVQLGLYCSIPGDLSGTITLSCAGGIAQDFPNLAIAIGAVTPVSVVVETSVNNEPVSFSGTGSTVVQGALGSLTLTAPKATSMVVTGGTTVASYSSSGSAAAFALFPPTPTSWTLTDPASGLQVNIVVLSNTTRNLSITITKPPSTTALATGGIDQSGTGTIVYSDGSSEVITNWTLGGTAKEE